MAFQSVPLTMSADINMLQRSVPIQMTFYFRVPELSYTAAVAEDIASALATFYNEEMATELPVECLGSNITVTGLQELNDFQVIDIGIAAQAGARVNTFPNSVVWAVSRRSSLTGRSARGRVFWPVASFSASAANENFMDAGQAGAIVNLLNAITAAVQIEVPAALQVIVSRYANGAKRPVGVTYDVVQYAPSDLQLDQLGGRMPD